MPKLEIFDPPMCCSSGVCGPRVDPVLSRFAADVDWLKQQGVDIGRFNPAQEPQAFVANAIVATALAANPDTSLPLILVDGRVVSRGTYPSRKELAGWAGLAAVPASEPARLEPRRCDPGCC